MKQKKERWEKTTLRRSLKNKAERHEAFETSSGIPLERVYLPDSADANFEQQLGFPGEYPYTRG
ncbi:MAG: methylmalonyl-CoA mutase family protein, partial [Anaerolineales bacterium]|nr:methylmalonyl-CoA mutase family protein [Anaerolineales bacterium]